MVNTQFRAFINATKHDLGRDLADHIVSLGGDVEQDLTRSVGAQTLVDVFGPDLPVESIPAVRQKLIDIATAIVAGGGQVYSLELHAGGLSDNLFGDNPQLQAKPEAPTPQQDERAKLYAKLKEGMAREERLNKIAQDLRAKLDKVVADRDALVAKHEPGRNALPDMTPGNGRGH